jgi:hypothetical protein
MDKTGKDDWSKSELEEYQKLKSDLATGLKGDEYNKKLKRYLELKEIARRYVSNHKEKYKFYSKEIK